MSFLGVFNQHHLLGCLEVSVSFAGVMLPVHLAPLSASLSTVANMSCISQPGQNFPEAVYPRPTQTQKESCFMPVSGSTRLAGTTDGRSTSHLSHIASERCTCVGLGSCWAQGKPGRLMIWGVAQFKTHPYYHGREARDERARPTSTQWVTRIRCSQRVETSTIHRTTLAGRETSPVNCKSPYPFGQFGLRLTMASKTGR